MFQFVHRVPSIFKRVNSAFDTVCARGAYLDTDDTCELCPKGEYNDAYNQTSCTPCTGGTTTETTGAVSVADCGEYTDRK